MSEDYGDYFAENERVSEENGEHWRGVKSPDGGFHEVTPEPSEPEQVPVWVKLVKADHDANVRVYMDELPPVSFGYAFFVTWKFLLASVLWGLIIGFIWGVLYIIGCLIQGRGL